MQCFVRNPRGGKAKTVNEDDLRKFNGLLLDNNFGKITVHAPYTMNVCSPKEDVRSFGIEMMAEDLNLMEFFPGNFYNFHPGSAVGQSEDIAIGLIAHALNSVLTDDIHSVVLLETMAGKGTEIGRSFHQLKSIIEKVNLSDKVGVCLDTCHVWDGGYDIADNAEKVLDEFDKIIGLEKLKAIHLNDSKNILNSRKDRHELIGKGKIGFDNIINFLKLPYIKSLPVNLETPTDDNGHKEEIAMLRNVLES